MKIVFLHGLGQTARDWKKVVDLIPEYDTECPELFSISSGELTYSNVLAEFEKRYEKTTEPFILCGLSLGGVLALDYTIRHRDKVSSLVLIGAQYKVPTGLIDFQNFLFRFMPEKSFEETGLSKNDMIKLSHSMRKLDFTSELSKIVCPVTVLCGEKDSANLKAAKALAKALPGAKLSVIPSVGHEVNKSSPWAIADALAQADKTV